MLLTDVRTEAGALRYLALDPESGVDPEVAAAQWAEATRVELGQVVREARLPKSEWVEDFISAHQGYARRTLRERGDLARFAMVCGRLPDCEYVI